MNITDVDDKIIRNSARDGVTVQQYTARFTKAFLEDSATLSIEQPVLVRATEHIPEMADFISELEKKASRTAPTMVPTISGLQNSPDTASSRKRILPG